MDREKQIEEIAKAMCGGCPDNKECIHGLCADWYRAEALYNAGYRKQSEIAKEIFDEIERTLDNYHSACCPIGEIETYCYYEGDLGKAIAELKKKYTDC